MTAKLTAEWLKLTTTRTFYWLLAGGAAVAAVGAFSTISATTPAPWHMSTPLHEQTMWVLATINGSIFALIVGARTFTDEFRHNSIAHTYIADPRRISSTFAKAGAAAAAGTLVGAVVAGATTLVATAMALLSGGDIAFHGRDLGPTAGLVAAMALWSVLGAGLGALVRNHVVVVASGLIWILMLENLGAGLLEDAGRFLPGQAVHAIAQTTESIDALALGPAAVLMAGYATLFVVAALAVTRRRDVT